MGLQSCGGLCGDVILPLRAGRDDPNTIPECENAPGRPTGGVLVMLTR